MNTSKKPVEKAKNYSDAQVQYLIDNSPFDLAKAKETAELDLFKDKSHQSIIAKVKNLDLEYIPKPAPRKKKVQATKVELVGRVQKLLNLDDSCPNHVLDGLEQSTRGALLKLINMIQHAIPPKVEPALPEIGDSD
jgi:hypothetical protein